MHWALPEPSRVNIAIDILLNAFGPEEINALAYIKQVLAPDLPSISPLALEETLLTLEKHLMVLNKVERVIVPKALEFLRRRPSNIMQILRNMSSRFIEAVESNKPMAPMKAPKLGGARRQIREHQIHQRSNADHSTIR